MMSAKNGMTSLVVPDHVSKNGAEKLARRLEAYWQNAGYPSAKFTPVVVDERFKKAGPEKFYGVRCNLVNGTPPGPLHREAAE